jgi:hypothetical protein
MMDLECAVRAGEAAEKYGVSAEAIEGVADEF